MFSIKQKCPISFAIKWFTKIYKNIKKYKNINLMKSNLPIILIHTYNNTRSNSDLIKEVVNISTPISIESKYKQIDQRHLDDFIIYIENQKLVHPDNFDFEKVFNDFWLILDESCDTNGLVSQISQADLDITNFNIDTLTYHILLNHLDGYIYLPPTEQNFMNFWASLKNQNVVFNNLEELKPFFTEFWRIDEPEVLPLVSDEWIQYIWNSEVFFYPGLFIYIFIFFSSWAFLVKSINYWDKHYSKKKR